VATVAPATSYRAIVGLMRLLLRAFFRRVEVAGQRHLPQTRGVLLVSWHPNGLVDPALVFSHALAAGLRRVPAGAIYTGGLTFLACAIGGAAAVRYVRVARETGRAIAVRITRGRRRLARVTKLAAPRELARGVRRPIGDTDAMGAPVVGAVDCR
jgi:hypothetical protein